MDLSAKMELGFYIALCVLGFLLLLVARGIRLFSDVWQWAATGDGIGKRFLRYIAIVAAGAVIVFVLMLSITGYRCADINEDMQRLLKEDVHRFTLDAICLLEERIEEQGILGTLYIENTEELAALKQKTEAFLDEEAAWRIADIDALEPIEEIDSPVTMRTIEYNIKRLKIEADLHLSRGYRNHHYCEALKQRVTNYDKFLEYEATYYELMEAMGDVRACRRCDGIGSVGAECDKCKGTGELVAEDGITRIRCDRCPYPGRMAVDCDLCENGFIYSENKKSSGCCFFYPFSRSSA